MASSIRMQRPEVIGLVGLFLTLCGCLQQPPTDVDEILDYIRNAAAGADVRRLDSGSQAYVDTIFANYMAWKTRHAPIESLAQVKGLWEMESSLWRHEDAIKGVLEQIEAWESDAPRHANPDSKTRAQVWQDLNDAIHDVPAIAQTSDRDFTAKVQNELACQAYEEWLGQVAADFKALFHFVADHAADFDPQSTQGLRFQSPANQKRAEELWQAAHDRLIGHAKQTVHQYQTDYDRQRTEVIARKKQLYQKGLSSASDLRQFRQLEVDIGYYEHLRIQAETLARDIGMPWVGKGDHK